MQADLDSVGKAFSETLTDIYRKTLAPAKDGEGVFHPWTEF